MSEQTVLLTWTDLDTAFLEVGWLRLGFSVQDWGPERTQRMGIPPCSWHVHERKHGCDYGLASGDCSTVKEARAACEAWLDAWIESMAELSGAASALTAARAPQAQDGRPLTLAERVGWVASYYKGVIKQGRVGRAAEVKDLREKLAAAESRAADLERRVGVLTALLRRAVESMQPDDCPVCAVLGRDASGHRPDCALMAALADAGQEEKP